MTRPDFSTREGVEAYRAELRQVGRRPRLFGFGLILAGAALTLLAPYAGAMGQAVQWAGYAALAAGWVLLLAAIFMRTRHHRRRLRELDGGGA